MEKNLKLYFDTKRNLKTIDIFNGLDKTLQSSAIIRNHKSVHGQGSTKRELLIMYAEYALQVTAANILLLIGIYNESV